MTKPIAAFFKNIFPVIIALVLCAAVSGCQKEEGTMEETGKKIDQGIEKTGEIIGEGVEAVKDAGITIGEKAEEGFETAKKESAEGVEAAKDAGIMIGEKTEEDVEATKDALGLPVEKTGEQTQQ